MLRIFVADDDKIIREGLKVIIEEANREYKVVGEATNGVEALRAIESLKPDVLVVDINMPEMDGVELIKQLRSSQNTISIIVLSGFDEYRYVRESMKHGALDYLLKPVNNESLIELLDRIDNELALIKENKEKALVQSVIFEESMTLLKGKLINELVKGNGMNNPKIEELLLDFGIASTGNIILSVIGTDNICKMEKDKLKGITFSPGYIIESYILNNFGSGSDKQIISAATDYEVIILTFSNNSTDFDEYIYGQFEAIRREIEKKETFTICAGISHVFSNIRKSHIPYHQALFSLKRRFYEGGNKIIKYLQESSCYAYINENIINNYFDRIINSIEITDTVRTGKIIEEMLAAFRKSNGDPEQIRKICIELVQKTSIRLNEFKNALELFPQEDLNMILYIESLDTYDELKNYLAGAFCRIMEQIKLERSYKTRKIPEKAKEYIKMHYKENITLKSVADHVYLNSSYFSELFKNETGKNFIDYLIETRINEAKKLLEMPDIKVYEVGEKVGYEDPVSFNRAFKKIVGISPNEYRSIIK